VALSETNWTCRVLCDVEESAERRCWSRFLLGVEAVGLDRQLHGGLRAEVERSLEALELAFDGHQPVEVTNVKLDARARRIQTPGGLADIESVGGVAGLDCHGRSSAASAAVRVAGRGVVR
jgi:hypothetical protein